MQWRAQINIFMQSDQQYIMKHIGKIIAVALVSMFLCLIYIWATTPLCGLAMTWAINEQTGKCAYFNTECIPDGYSYADGFDFVDGNWEEYNFLELCDCNNLEDSSVEACIEYKELLNRYQSRD